MAEIKKKIIVEDWTFVVRVKVNPGCKRDVNIEVRHASTAPLSLHEEVKSAHSSKISVRVAAKPTIDSFGPTPEQRPKRFEHVPYALSDMATLQLPTCHIRKYDSCWEQEGETQSDGDEELEFLYSRQKVAKTAASAQQHVDEKSSISELPTEILMQILHFLPPLDIIQSVQAVSHAWQSISCDESFWHLVYGRHVGNPDFRPKHGWKTACRSALDALHLHQHMCREAQARKRELFQWRHFSWLCKKGHSKLVEQMLRPRDVFLNVNTQDKESECTALMVAAMKGHGDIVAMLCAQSAALDLTDRHGITALMYAAREGHLAPLQTLLAAGADCNAKTNNGSTCLMIAAKEGYHQIVSCLLRHGASDECNQNGSTALTFAAEKARSEAVEVLLQHNANVNAKTNKRGITPLIFSVKARDLVTARMLMEHGANVNAQTSRTKYTALIAAVRNKDEDMIKLLLEFNADPCLTCHMGRNAFDYAEEEGIDYLRIPSTTPVQAI